MAAPRFDRAASLVELLRESGVTATRSVPDALAKLPCVLVPPPTIGPGTYGSATTTWRLVALAADPLGGEDAWQQIDQLLDQVCDALPVDRAEPIAYALPGDQPPLPAYAITYTES